MTLYDTTKIHWIKWKKQQTYKEKVVVLTADRRNIGENNSRELIRLVTVKSISCCTLDSAKIMNITQLYITVTLSECFNS